MKWIILFWICFCVTEIEGGPLNQIDDTGNTFFLLLFVSENSLHQRFIADHPNVWNIQLCFIFGFKDTKEKS